MRLDLRLRLLFLFACVAAISLSAAILLRGFIIGDIKRYLDGEAQDRIHRAIAVIEGHYGEHGGWDSRSLETDLVWALQTGMTARVYDAEGGLLLDTGTAVRRQTPPMTRRLLGSTPYDPEDSRGEFTPYPLFMKGEEIGRIEFRQLSPVKEEYLIASSNRYLAYTVLALGLTAIGLAVVGARRLARPIQQVSRAAGEIAAGDLSGRLQVTGPHELVSLAASFNHMADALEAQEKLRRRLVSTAAHELRTPLAIIAGELEGMIDGVLPMDREALHSLHQETRRLTAILDGVDDLTRAEAGVASLQMEEIDLQDFLAQIVGRFKRLFDEKQAVLLLDCPQRLLLRADPDRLSQIVINLLSNALKAIGTGGRVAMIAAKEGGAVALEVRDDGAGIPEAEQAAVFERFYKGSGDGLGLGLAIVRELVNAHGGRIDLASTPGQGSTFRVMLPIAESPCVTTL